MLNEKKKELLREFCNRRCEECGKHESKVGKLIPHRINRGYTGGEYCLRNIKMICKDCHKLYHGGEF